MRRIKLTRSASQDIDDIWYYIAVENHSPAPADKLIDDFDLQFGIIARHPTIGESVEKLRPNTRRIVARKRYLVFYEGKEEEILILRVLHGARLIQPGDLEGSD